LLFEISKSKTQSEACKEKCIFVFTKQSVVVMRSNIASLAAGPAPNTKTQNTAILFTHVDKSVMEYRNRITRWAAAAAVSPVILITDNVPARDRC
jgi:hypothetical protein